MLFLRLILFACLLILTAAHESCCKHKLQQQELVSELMEDPDEIPPAVSDPRIGMTKTMGCGSPCS
jgi:hypothetical protein